MIPTAAEFFDKGNFNNVTDMLIEFAKLHVEAFRQNLLTNHLELWDDCEVTTKECIENAYPLTNIK